jgi:hypothetical protein
VATHDVWPVPDDLELTDRHASVRALDPARDTEAVFDALDPDRVSRTPSGDALVSAPRRWGGRLSAAGRG